MTIVVGVLLTLFMGTTTAIHYWAVSQAESATCLGEAGERGETSQIRRSISVLEQTGQLPWLAQSAAYSRAQATLRCVGELREACGLLRDEAVSQAVESRDLELTTARGEETHWLDFLDASRADATCQEWNEWLTWLESQSVNTEQLCPIC